MNAAPSREWDRDRDLFSFAVGFAVIAGGLSVAIPFLAGLALALTCIVFAVWLVESFSRSHDPARAPRYRRTGAWIWISVGLFVGALVLYFGAPASHASFRGLVLLVSPLTCWWTSRSGIVRGYSI
ncbi:MAG: hypothetical protein WB778_08680 [Thermoplasmata archaeon]|jgi:hypothetical protein